jgi:hypothetical protein
MKIKIQMVIEGDDGSTVEEITSLEKENLSQETLGLSLQDAKNILAETQKILVSHQVTDY